MMTLTLGVVKPLKSYLLHKQINLYSCWYSGFILDHYNTHRNFGGELVHGKYM